MQIHSFISREYSKCWSRLWRVLHTAGTVTLPLVILCHGICLLRYTWFGFQGGVCRDGIECSPHQQTVLHKQVPWGTRWVGVPHRYLRRVPAALPWPPSLLVLSVSKWEDSLLTGKAAGQQPLRAVGPVARPARGGMSLPNGRLQSPSPWRGAGDRATQAFQFCVIAKFHKGIFMLSECCLLHESNYRSCHGGVTRRWTERS